MDLLRLVAFDAEVLAVISAHLQDAALRVGDLTYLSHEHCFALDAFRIEKRLRPGKPVSVELTPDRAGTFPFHCCLESGTAAETEKGQLVVAE